MGHRTLWAAVALVGGIYFLAKGSVFHVVEFSPSAVTLSQEFYPTMMRKEVELKLRPGTNKMIEWRFADRRRTDLCLLQIHGFGASRKEISPAGEGLAERLGANLFMTRLTGHGLTGAELGVATAAEWLQDVEEGFAVCRRIGNRVGLLATSTGAPLALHLMRAYPSHVAFAVMVSPNFRPKDPMSLILKGPVGGFITRYLWTERSWTPPNAEVEKYWTTTYPTTALTEMMNLLSWTETFSLSNMRTPLLVFYTEEDSVISVSRIKKAFEIYGGPKELVDVPDAPHVLAGSIFHSSGTRLVVEKAIAFLNSLTEGESWPRAQDGP